MRSTCFLALLLAAACTGHNPAYVQDQGAGSDAAARVDAPTDRAVGGGETGTFTDAPGADEPGADGTVLGPVDAPPTDEPVSDASPTGPPGADAPAADLAPAPDLASDGAFTPPAGCGTGTARLDGITGADGVAVDTDGTVYFLTDDPQKSYVGRIEVNKKPEVQWLPVEKSPTTWGLALDSAHQRLYVLVVDGKGGITYFDDIHGTPKGGILVSGISNGNDLAVGPDGTVYYSQQGDRLVYSVPYQGGTPTPVSKVAFGDPALMQAPAALAFTPDGNLLVGLEHGGPLHSLTMNGTIESMRNQVGKWTGWANGLAFDRRGQLYISIYDDTAPRSVVRLRPDNTSSEPILTGGRFSSIAFGRGALDCRDLYVADPYGPMQVVPVPDSL